VAFAAEANGGTRHCTASHGARLLLDCGVDAKPQVVIVQSGGKPTIRSVLVDGVEIHRCRTRDLVATDPKSARK